MMILIVTDHLPKSSLQVLQQLQWPSAGTKTSSFLQSFGSTCKQATSGHFPHSFGLGQQTTYVKVSARIAWTNTILKNPGLNKYLLVEIYFNSGFIHIHDLNLSGNGYLYNLISANTTIMRMCENKVSVWSQIARNVASLPYTCDPPAAGGKLVQAGVNSCCYSRKSQSEQQRFLISFYANKNLSIGSSRNPLQTAIHLKILLKMNVKFVVILVVSTFLSMENDKNLRCKLL